jgi:2,3-bisphosphoglycerate-independent phosphoglycerate mutase
MNTYKPVVLVVLDGWGLSNLVQGNPIREGKLPTFDKMSRFYPMVALQASGISVGLPWNTAGNSEVGHMTLGAGRVIYQNLPRIALSIQDGTFFKNPALLKAIENCKKNKSAFHLMGLVSSGSVHSHKDHLFALLRLAKDQGLEKVFVHCFMDGRDSAPTSGIQHIEETKRLISVAGVGTIASVIGRNWAMDRNNNWDRVEKAYRMLVAGKGEYISDVTEYLEQSYLKGITDEYVEPAVVTEHNAPIALIKEKDSVIFYNFREDRARELTKAFVLPSFDKFERQKFLDIDFVTMTEYERDLPLDIAFPPEDVQNSLGEILSKNGKKQLRIAETEKYAHVTYFFNGGKEKPFPDEDRILIPSQIVSHFDEVPEMSAPKITETVLEAIEKGNYDFILINYANADMVAHTGNEEASIEAVEATDKTMSILIPAVLKANGCLFVTADHGNAEELKKNATGEIDTEHSTNPVPMWFISPSNHIEKSDELIAAEQNEVRGLLSDVAPTILDLMGIKDKPAEMNGASLLELLQ